MVQNAGGLGQAVDLQNRDAEHSEIVLRLRRQGRRSADQGLQIFADHLLSDRGKHDGVREPKPEASPAEGFLLFRDHAAFARE